MVNLLIAITGSVASIRCVKLIEEIRKQCSDIHLPVEIKVIATKAALHFTSRGEITSTNVELLTDEDEWTSWKGLGDPVLHIELRKWADLMLIAPLDANTLAKAANGLCDNLVTCVLRAWEVSKPLYLAPAMNTAMWNHPMTEEHINRVKSFGYTLIPPISKKLACADVGVGAMAEYNDIASIIVTRMASLASSNQ